MGTAQRARERKKRSLAKKVYWLTDLYQAAASHHTARDQKAQQASQAASALDTRLITLEKELAQCKGIILRVTAELATLVTNPSLVVNTDSVDYAETNTETVVINTELVADPLVTATVASDTVVTAMSADKSRPPAGAGGGPTSADVGISGTADMVNTDLVATDLVANTELVDTKPVATNTDLVANNQHYTDMVARAAAADAATAASGIPFWPCRYALRIRCRHQACMQSPLVTATSVSTDQFTNRVFVPIREIEPAARVFEPSAALDAQD